MIGFFGMIKAINSCTNDLLTLGRDYALKFKNGEISASQYEAEMVGKIYEITNKYSQHDDDLAKYLKQHFADPSVQFIKDGIEVYTDSIGKQMIQNQSKDQITENKIGTIGDLIGNVSVSAVIKNTTQSIIASLQDVAEFVEAKKIPIEQMHDLEHMPAELVVKKCKKAAEKIGFVQEKGTKHPKYSRTVDGKKQTLIFKHDDKISSNLIKENLRSAGVVVKEFMKAYYSVG